MSFIGRIEWSLLQVHSLKHARVIIFNEFYQTTIVALWPQRIKSFKHFINKDSKVKTLTFFHPYYSTVQLQLHITTRYHACQCVHYTKSSRVPRRDSAWHTSTATSNIPMRGN